MLMQMFLNSEPNERDKKTVKVNGIERELYYEMLITQPELNCVVLCHMDP